MLIVLWRSNALLGTVNIGYYHCISPVLKEDEPKFDPRDYFGNKWIDLYAHIVIPIYALVLSKVTYGHIIMI